MCVLTVLRENWHELVRKSIDLNREINRTWLILGMGLDIATHTNRNLIVFVFQIGPFLAFTKATFYEETQICQYRVTFDIIIKVDNY